jgi:hypothetical protein
MCRQGLFFKNNVYCLQILDDAGFLDPLQARVCFATKRGTSFIRWAGYYGDFLHMLLSCYMCYFWCYKYQLPCYIHRMKSYERFNVTKWRLHTHHFLRNACIHNVATFFLRNIIEKCYDNIAYVTKMLPTRVLEIASYWLISMLTNVNHFKYFKVNRYELQ